MLWGLAPFLASWMCLLRTNHYFPQCVLGWGVSVSHNHHVWLPTRWHALCHAPLFNVSLCEVSYVQMRDLRPTRLPEVAQGHTVHRAMIPSPDGEPQHFLLCNSASPAEWFPSILPSMFSSSLPFLLFYFFVTDHLVGLMFSLALVTPVWRWVTDLWWHSHSLCRSPHIRKYSQGANVLLCNTLGLPFPTFPPPEPSSPTHNKLLVKRNTTHKTS